MCNNKVIIFAGCIMINDNIIILANTMGNKNPIIPASSAMLNYEVLIHA